MTINNINLYIAKQTMALRAAYGSAATVLTVWNGSPLLITWNCRSKSIMFDSIHNAVLDEEDKRVLTGLIKEFYQPLYFEKEIN